MGQNANAVEKAFKLKRNASQEHNLHKAKTPAYSKVVWLILHCITRSLLAVTWTLTIKETATVLLEPGRDIVLGTVPCIYNH